MNIHKNRKSVHKFRMEDRKVWANERLRNGKATGKLLKWKNGSGEELRYRCIIGHNRWGENVGRVLIALDDLMLRSKGRPRAMGQYGIFRHS